jgi:RimJ/RimL family protein N-acetyltransferase
MLRDETVARVLAFWSRWAAADDADGVGIVEIGDHRFCHAPAHLRDRVASAPADLDAVVSVLGDDVDRAVGVARLAYADDRTLTLPDAVPLADISGDDARLAALQGGADPAEWQEASADEACDARLGVVERNELVALATMRVWDDTVDHIGVFTRADARGRGLAGDTAAGVIRRGLERNLVPQWRSRLGNDASVAVADRLGFVRLGVELFVRVRPLPARSRTMES